MNGWLVPFILWVVIFVQFVLLTDNEQNDEFDSDLIGARGRVRRSDERELFSGETYDYTGEYRIVRFYEQNSFETEWQWDDVTLVTHASMDKLHLLARLVTHWHGLISVALFVPDLDASYAHGAINKLRYCDPLISKYVAFHLVYPADQPADISERDVLEQMSCEEFSHRVLPSFDKEKIVYPHNVLRNVARSAVYTEFFTLIDVDLQPSPGLRKKFLAFIEAQGAWEETSDEKEVYIIPAFEMAANQEMPKTKSELVELYTAGQLRPFHTDTCANCHAPEQFEKWSKLSDESDQLNIAFDADWEEHWEPFYFARRNIPMYDERFKEHLFDRIQQICELYLAGFKFRVFDGAYLTHRGMKSVDENHVHYTSDKFVWDLFNYHFKDELQRKYNTTRTCSPLTGAELKGPSGLRKRKVNDDFNRYQIQRNQMGRPVALPNDTPVMFEGILQRGALKGHDHSISSVVFDPARVLKRYTPDELRALLEAGAAINEMKDINDPDDKCDDPPCMSWEI